MRGVPRGSRTRNLRLRRPLLCPVELGVHWCPTKSAVVVYERCRPRRVRTWCAREDLNLQQPLCQSGALPLSYGRNTGTKSEETIFRRPSPFRRPRGMVPGVGLEPTLPPLLVDVIPSEVPCNLESRDETARRPFFGVLSIRPPRRISRGLESNQHFHLGMDVILSGGSRNRYGQKGSNLRYPVCKTGALPLSYARVHNLYLFGPPGMYS